MPCDSSTGFADSSFPLSYGLGESCFIKGFKEEWMKRAPSQSGLSMRGRLVSHFWLMVSLFTSDMGKYACLDHPSDRAAPPIP